VTRPVTAPEGDGRARAGHRTPQDRRPNPPVRIEYPERLRPHRLVFGSPGVDGVAAEADRVRRGPGGEDRAGYGETVAEPPAGWTRRGLAARVARHPDRDLLFPRLGAGTTVPGSGSRSARRRTGSRTTRS